MKASDADILIIPGYTNSGPDHWQTRWQSRLSTARRVEQEAWSKPVREDWIANVVTAVNEAEKPVVLVAHSLGVATAVQAIPEFRKPVAGAFFVAPPDVSYEVAEDIAAAWGSLFMDAGDAGHINAESGFGPWPEGSMTFAKFLQQL